MSLQAIARIRAVEDSMERAKADARAKAQKIVADAEREGRELLQRGREASDEAAAAMMRQAEEEAEKRRKEILEQAEKDCDALKAGAATATRMEKATQAILRRVVES